MRFTRRPPRYVRQSNVAKINAVLQAETDAQRVESTSGTLAPEDLHAWIREHVRRTLSSRPEELAETLFGIPFGVFVPTADLTRVRLGSAETRVVAGNKRKQATAGSTQSAKLVQEIHNVENRIEPKHVAPEERLNQYTVELRVKSSKSPIFRQAVYKHALELKSEQKKN